MLESTWQTIRKEALFQASQEPILASYLHATILNHSSPLSALSYLLANKLDSPTASALLIREVIEEAFEADESICEAAAADLHAILDRDSACHQLSVPFLYFKGYHALQAFRVAHWLWQQERKAFALFLQNRISVVFSVDIHPAARIGKGVMLDHATGVVIGETAVVDDDVSIMQSVTLGGTGKQSGDRHPKIRRGVLIGPGAKILGNIEIGEGVQVGAGSVVLKPVPPHRVVAGVPAEDLGEANADNPAEVMCHLLQCKKAKASAVNS
ncbi:serine O-acetyltransferase [Halioxenophilus sp. WMMB6]|uniref:serine O-acetyltransferase n=1 Tax=Halioxenophilus sp. WMMB6 TaxID=3073815 RepID=UPI00295E9BBB|nr:serine O-acetyltransferase [Halioxenophilus sp. WMMB6]